MIHTPDGDTYVERLSCLGDEGPAKLRGLTSNLTLPRNLRARAYRFRGRMTDDYIKQVFREALKVAEDEGFTPEIPSEIVDKGGTCVDLNGFFMEISPMTSLPRTLGQPCGSVWVAAEPLAGLVPGQEVSLTEETDVQVGDRCALAFRKGEYVKVEMTGATEAASYADRRRSLLVDSKASGSGECPVDPPRAPGPDSKDEVSQDSEVRTLWVDYDEHGERFKRWRDVVKEGYTPVFEDKPLEGPATALHVILWLQMWLRTKDIETSDRTYGLG